MKTVHITTGDVEGIGLEISVKALLKIGPVEGVQFVLWRSSRASEDLLKQLDQVFKRVNAQKNSIEKKSNILLDQIRDSGPTSWVVEAANRCLKNPEQEKLVTGPLSKTQMQKEGFKERGHTELLKKISHTKQVFMTFLGQNFNVVLLTGHLPLKKIKWNSQDLVRCIELCLELKNKLPPEQQRKKVALLGFNPHAGEEGLLGKEEFKLKKILEKYIGLIEGPMVPDIAFFKNNWKRIHTYICLYHDQALIPFKMVHERASFQLSLGLPFMRTSVSHGTALDIAGKNQASSESMEQALLWLV